MKKYILLLMAMLLFLACETGVRYDKNTSVEKVPVTGTKSGLVEHSMDASIKDLLDDEEEDERVEPSVYQTEVAVKINPFDEQDPLVKSYSGGVVTDGLDVYEIREGKHDGYIRLVFDVNDHKGKAKQVGSYVAKYSAKKQDISVRINGYRKFSAPLPSFSSTSVIEQIYFEKSLDDSAFKFHIKLRDNAEVKVFDLPNYARLVFDIKPI